MGALGYNTPSGLLYGEYSWRVRAVDGAGDESEWPDLWTLRIVAGEFPLGL